MITLQSIKRKFEKRMKRKKEGRDMLRLIDKSYTAEYDRKCTLLLFSLAAA